MGDNARATLITRGLAELIALGTKLGGEPLTLAGLAGMGDLVATCISPQSRNSHVGRELGQGKTIDDILGDMDQVAEGIKAAKVVKELATEYEVDMPIADVVYRVCWQGERTMRAFGSLVRSNHGHE